MPLFFCFCFFFLIFILGFIANEFSLFLNDVSEGFFGNIYKASEWKKLKSKELGLSNSRIPKSAKVVLNMLKRQGKRAHLDYIH